MKTQITVYGYGYVGKALVGFLKDHYALQLVDPVFKKFLGPELKKEFPELAGFVEEVCFDHTAADPTKYAVICVPTPMSDDGSCDTSIVEDILRNTDHEFYLIKSTIVPGTTERLAKETGKNICFSPEYIGEGRYEIPFWLNLPHPTNMKLHTFHIFGGPVEVTREFVNLWQKVAGWSATYQQTDSRTAELTKYMENSFLALKKIFCDEFYEIAKTFGVDYNELKELWLLDGRVGRSMTLIFPDKRGFGGKCLPKDTNAIVKAAKLKGYNPGLLIEMLASNQKFIAMNMENQDEVKKQYEVVSPIVVDGVEKVAGDVVELTEADAAAHGEAVKAKEEASTE